MDKKKSSDSRLLDRLLRGVLPWDHYLEKSGDLEEAHRSFQEEKGSIRAGIWYARQVLQTIKLFVF